MNVVVVRKQACHSLDEAFLLFTRGVGVAVLDKPEVFLHLADLFAKHLESDPEVVRLDGLHGVFTRYRLHLFFLLAYHNDP